ncbi:hypothetical protein D3C75_1272710 [compost metagenome]
MVANLLSEIFTSRNPQFCREDLDKHRHEVGPHHHPQQFIAEAGTGLDVGRKVTRIDITDGSDKSRPHQRQA